MKLHPSIVCVVIVLGCLGLLSVDRSLDVKDIMIGATAGYFGYVSDKGEEK